MFTPRGGGWRVDCSKCNTAWWDTETQDKEKVLARASFDHCIDKDHDAFLTAFQHRDEPGRREKG